LHAWAPCSFGRAAALAAASGRVSASRCANVRVLHDDRAQFVEALAVVIEADEILGDILASPALPDRRADIFGDVTGRPAAVVGSVRPVLAVLPEKSRPTAGRPRTLCPLGIPAPTQERHEGRANRSAARAAAGAFIAGR
jgi:hypothetical protein